jgi:hypothetical protein
VPLSHPFIKRLIRTLRREFLDHVFSSNANDLEPKLEGFRRYYNAHRVHTSLNGDTPSESADEAPGHRADLNRFRWKAHCRGLYRINQKTPFSQRPRKKRERTFCTLKPESVKSIYWRVSVASNY